jgi:Acetyltransferase (GNAT) domain
MFEITGPVAYGTPWFQRSRYLLAPLRRPFVALRRVEGRTGDGQACSVLVVDEGPTLSLLLSGMLEGPTQVTPLGRASVLRIPAILHRALPAHDLVVARVPQLLAEALYADGFFRLPWGVDMWARTDEILRRRQRGRGTVASGFARWKQQGFRSVQRRDAGSLDLFYETMYLPFASTKFGEAAQILDRGSMRRALEHGTLLWIEQDGRPVAAQLLERCGATLHTISVGTSLDPAASQAAGVLTALKVSACELAVEMGLEWLDFGGCMPWLTDGVLQNKRQWGGELVLRGGLHRGVVAGWSAWTPAAAAFLALAPVFRHGGSTFSVTTATPKSHLPANKLSLPGVGRFFVVDAPVSAARADSSAVGTMDPGPSRAMVAQAAGGAGGDPVVPGPTRPQAFGRRAGIVGGEGR